jgi:serine/threonine-protein kinase
MNPFFSPDGQWIGFFANIHLKKISVHGGAPVDFGGTAGATSMGSSWGQDGYIITATGHIRPLSRIPAGGGPLLVAKLSVE